ncbi:MAG: carbamoyltransferase [Myxococcales bacterium]|nr:carbamoyltransferase [Myxococcales bacterium]
MTTILGISAFYHDSAACLVRDGEIVAAAQEERFSRIKHDYRFPKQAIDFCLGEAGITPEDVNHVAFYDKPLLKFDRLLETYLAYAPVGFRSFLKAMPLWLREKLHHPRELDRGLEGRYKGRYIFTEHHESHAASAFFPSPFEEAALLTIDGVGEWATASLGYGRENRIELTHELRFPHSLGLLYSAFTYFCGFKVNSGEYKLMGLAPYGEPKYKNLILKHLIDLKEDGSFRLDMSYFNYCQGLTMTSRKMNQLFGGPPRRSETHISEREMDIAASIQAVTEEIILRMTRHLARMTGSKNLVLAGGVALNCVGNGKIARDGAFDNVWVQPAAGDAGGALGAALFTWFQLLGNERKMTASERQPPTDLQSASLLGSRYTNAQIREFLDSVGATYVYYEDEEQLLEVVSGLISNEQVVGHFQGRMEFGPRALGSRSIIGDARSKSMQSTMNLKIKFRESFRPFAPCVLVEHAHDWFMMRPGQESPYMLLVAPVLEKHRVSTGRYESTGLERLRAIRSSVPAITHVDYSARVQTVDEERHGRFYRLMQKFYEQTGCPIVINTSFNIRGEPIVESPQNAYKCFLATDMDVLVLENCVLVKEEQRQEMATAEAERYLAQFELD